MIAPFSAFLIAAPSSGSGKTTLTLALLRLLSRRGLGVQPFKCGPDYLDTRLHGMAASVEGRERLGINLDTFMAPPAHARELFGRWSADADVAVVEGVMGLFDGAEKDRGSSAEIAKLLGLPVVMVVDARSMAYSAAPLLHGFRTFDARLNLSGVIFNRVNTPSHYSYLEAAARDAGVEPLGYVPKNEAIAISERHLGLNTSVSYDREGVIERMADHVAETLDIDRLLALSAVPRPEAPADLPRGTGGKRVIAVARDEAFSFLYQENLEVLRRYGRIEWFSPLEDDRLPEADLVCLAGGYPELYAEQLARNTAMRGAVAAYCRSGGRTWAECGGMMYLAEAITLADGSRHPMCGVLDLETTMQQASLTLGYRSLKLQGFTGELRGHEFHYSKLLRSGPLESIANVTTASGKVSGTPVYRKGNTFASYIHMYWGAEPGFPLWLLEA
ncbi:cobyrinate a,c-diamide synthase [Pelodictyon luteolum]|uniref:Cobyrinate a,c-diamide synthase n=1 Tax=Chlorobium luteolum (strain DSM 273 / BCRC 81028 / 2530) TaxID=319225 RepID=Q3B1K4_CHLL3|nr:cobyrinate a,c-diamide synthase [Pelodictyon luteolum]ABB24777.1 cobyrinate a,c-diamide synthase [Pelodictyon luteolum DSM 273]